ncbi:MAG: TolC family protein [Myxococcales bacterium]|nr:TolC family protein [Myxococcales bacterium]
MRRVPAILLIALCVPLPAAPARADDGPPITLTALLDAGRRSHPTLAKEPLIARARAISQAQLDQAYLPRLTLAGQATWQSEVTAIAIPLPGVTITPPAKDQYKVTLELAQSLWDGGVVAGQQRVAARRADVETAKVELEWYQVRERILQLYYAGVVQQELAHQAETLADHLATVHSKAEAARASGVVIERDVLLVEARQLEALQAAADAAAGLDATRRGLAELTGAPLTGRFEVADRCDAAPPGDAAALHRPELAVLTAQQRLLTAQDDAEAATDHPRVAAFATGGYGRPGLNALDDEFGFFAIGGVQVTVPLTYLYAGTRRKARRQLAVQQALLARSRDAVVTQVNVQLATQRAELTRLDAALVIDAQLVDVRARARAYTETQLALGTATMTDLVNDLTQEDLARSKRVVHQAQRSLACHQLAFIVGDL